MLIALFAFPFIYGADYQIEGHYYGENLYIQNPFSSKGIGYCIKQVIVNDIPLEDNIISTTFEIDFETLGIEVGQEVKVVIRHDDDCSPTIINAEVLIDPNGLDDISKDLFKIRPRSHLEGGQLIITYDTILTQCLIKGKVIDELTKKPIKFRTESGARASNIFIKNRVTDVFQGQILPRERDGAYIIQASYGSVYELEITSEGYYPKKVLLDLRGVPDLERYQRVVPIEFELKSFEEKSMNEMFAEFPVSKLRYDNGVNDLEWDEDYSKAILEALDILAVQVEKENEVVLLEKSKENDRLKLSQQNTIIYAVGGLLIIILASLILVYRNLQAKKKANKTISEQKTEIEEVHKEITDSIAYAKRIQSAILPPAKLVKKHLPNSFILYKPKDIVAGDFYWVEPTDHAILFAAADCTGHGVPGAMVSVICNSALNRSVREKGYTEPGEILNSTRNLVISEFEKSEEDVQDGMDIALCSLNGLQLQYAGANNPLWIVRKGEIIEIKADKQPIGKYTDSKPFNTHLIDLQKGDTFYVFSDGFVDQFGGDKGKKFKPSSFRKLLLSIQQQPLDKQKELLDQAFEHWRKDLEQIDDVCVIGVRV